MLPTCLHQIAEIYFQEENYEKAMQFIQLERMYHEQLLANLSAIQEQWEKKWKLTDSTSSPSPQNSEKCLSSKELETLSSLCGSHQEPKISKHKLSASEKTLKIQCLTQLIQTDGFRDLDSPAGTPVRESNSGSRPRKDRKPGVAAMTDNSPPNVISEDKPTEAADHQAMPELGHTEEQQLCSSRALLEVHTQSTGTVGRANPGSFSTGDAGKNNNLLQPEAASHCQDVTEIEAFSEDHREEHTGKPVADKLISAGAAQADCVSGAHDDLSGMISSLDCSSPIQTAKVISNIQEHCTIIGEGDAKELRLANPKLINIESTQREASESHESTSDPKCSLETERSAQRQAAVEFIASLLNGDLKDSENFLAHLDLQEEALSEEEMSPSPGDAVLGDSFLSLDELAKRIEVEEINPASGLVSILKKRNESEGEKLAETPQKPAKRKVRFQETDDVLDQEEIGGGSCILLVLLCVVTVFLSIGGTALYCTFGDVDSSVCKDFAANVDFYYTQLLQGFEELKHWLYVT
ncbi:consortin [Rhinophrynus dorsalis]